MDTNWFLNPKQTGKKLRIINLIGISKFEYQKQQTFLTLTLHRPENAFQYMEIRGQ